MGAYQCFAQRKRIAQPKVVTILNEGRENVDGGNLFARRVGNNVGDYPFTPFYLKDGFTLVGRDLAQFFEAKAAKRRIDLIERHIGMDGSEPFFADGEGIGQRFVLSIATAQKEGNQE